MLSGNNHYKTPPGLDDVTSVFLAPTIALSNSHQRVHDMSRFLQATILTALVASAVMPAFGSVLVKKDLEARQDRDNTVLVADGNAFW